MSRIDMVLYWQLDFLSDKLIMSTAPCGMNMFCFF